LDRVTTGGAGQVEVEAAPPRSASKAVGAPGRSSSRMPDVGPSFPPPSPSSNQSKGSKGSDQSKGGKGKGGKGKQDQTELPPPHSHAHLWHEDVSGNWSWWSETKLGWVATA